MKISKGEIKGIKFYYREGMSDFKTFEEVIGNETYLKKGMTIKSGETWMDCGATIGQKDNSILVYPAWKNVHGVTPIIPIHEDGYRNSLIFYPLKAFKGI